jgi:UDP-N-acetylmuramate dehydrogenase
MTGSKINKDFKELIGTLDADVRFDEPMKKHTYLGIGGSADIFVVPNSVEALSSLLKAADQNKVQALPVGGGTNLLVSDGGIEGAVISMASFDEIRIINNDSDSVTVYVDSGYPLMRLVRFAADRGLTGIEGLAGIPGQVGGAISGNAGAFDQEIKDVLINVMVMQRDGNVTDIRKDALNFEYRHAELPSGAIILGAVFSLGKDDPEAVSKRVDEFMKEKKSRQPLGERSAGCVYKNPPGGFAGRFIDEAGCKGMRVGGIEGSRVHANFFVNTGDGTAADYMNLMGEVSSKVKADSGIVLEPEIRMVGRC